MPIPFPSRPSAPLPWSGTAKKATPTTPTSTWRCLRCGGVLGMFREGRMHVSFSRGHEYFTGFPVQAKCRGCGTLNHTSGPAR